MDLQPGMFVGPYELIQRAGAGGFSVVWKARVPGGGQQAAGPAGAVAIKVPQVEKLVDHLRREARLARQLRDPQVVEIGEVHLDHDPPYLVMPWIDGRPLPLPSSAPAPQDMRYALERFLDLVRVIGRLHDAGIVHGDLKPGNVLLGADGRCHVLDLGLARLHVATRLDRSLAQSLVSVDGRSIAGTLDFMAPEVCDGQAPGFAADVYSLGVTLHHLMTGRPPAFSVSPASLNPYLPPGFDALLRAMLHHDPARRIERAGQVVPEIERLIGLEATCLARRNGHERRRVFQARMATLRRGLRPLLTGVALGALAVGIVTTISTASSLPSSAFRDLLMVIPVLVALVGVPGGFVALLLAMTTVNAWVLGIPEKTYKNRRGHPIWSFMMQ